jgi:GMP synthase (glutamine-hydrolysing)
MSAARPFLLAIQHVSWETPHRILGACGALAPRATVLHWHGDVFDLPEGPCGSPLPPDGAAGVSAWHGKARGVLFHPEADTALVESWLAEPQMLDEAIEALGPDASTELRGQARIAEDELIARSMTGFQAFADLVASHRPI